MCRAFELLGWINEMAMDWELELGGGGALEIRGRGSRMMVLASYWMMCGCRHWGRNELHWLHLDLICGSV